MTLRELKEKVDYFMDVQNGIWGNTEVSIPNNKRGMLGPTPTTKVRNAGVGIDWDSRTFFIWPETEMIEMPEKETSSDAACFIDNDMSDYVGFINFLRRETGMSKTHTLVALEQCRDEVAEVLKNWYRAHGKKTSTPKRELTLDERMHIWFTEHKPNRDVCDSVDEMNDIDKSNYLDECGIPKTI